MKTALCCIAKLENNYLREFVHHYLNLGFDHIYIYDNNDTDGEEVYSVLGDFSYYRYVTILNARGKEKIQLEAYHDCYNTFGKYYDWMAFFDCDEFLVINEKDINTFLSKDIFLNVHSIHINWVCYGDNENILYENKPLHKRFPNPILPLNYCPDNSLIPHNNYIKTILKTNLRNLVWCNDPHYLVINDLMCKIGNGDNCTHNFSLTNQPNYSDVYLRHYVTKSLEEWINVKMKRGYADDNHEKENELLTLERFFELNKYTKEKQDFIDKHCNS